MVFKMKVCAGTASADIYTTITTYRHLYHHVELVHASSTTSIMSVKLSDYLYLRESDEYTRNPFWFANTKSFNMSWREREERKTLNFLWDFL